VYLGHVPIHHLAPCPFRKSHRLSRVRKSTLPEDADSERKEMVPTYNRAGALQTITLDGTDYVRHVAYNAKGQRTLLAMGNDMMTRYAYDPLNYRLLRIRTEKYEEDDHVYEPQSGTTKQDIGYEYDLGGNIVKIKERVTDCGINGSLLGVDALDRTFTYDPLKRLLTATGRESNTTGNTNFWGEKGAPGTPNANNVRAYTQSYQYDGAGNIQQLGHAATGNSYTRHYWYPELYRLGQVDNGGSPSTVHASFLYDANGNQVKVNTDRYFLWDAFDQLRHFRIQSGSTISVQAQYLYAGGARVKKLVQDQFGNVQVTVYIDGVYEHRYTKDSVGVVQEEQTILHVMDGRSRIATVRVGDTMDDTGPAVKYNLEDHLGTSTTRLTDTGTLIDKEEYYPFGDSSLRTFEAKRYRYVGKELDNESGLYYYGARYYAAWVGRFISVDPLAAQYAHLTPYNYASNRPIGGLDVDGMQDPKEPKVPHVERNTPTKPQTIPKPVEESLDKQIKEALERETPQKSNPKKPDGSDFNRAIRVLKALSLTAIAHEVFTSSSMSPEVAQRAFDYAHSLGFKNERLNESFLHHYIRTEKPPIKVERDTKEDGKNLVYRGGKFNPANFTVRENDLDEEKYGLRAGFSTFDNHNQATQGEGGPSQVLDLNIAKALGFIEVRDGTHVSLRLPSKDEELAWAKTRPDMVSKQLEDFMGFSELKKVHVRTVLLMLTRVKQFDTPKVKK